MPKEQSTASRISELRKLQDGWDAGNGYAFSENVLMLAHQMVDCIEASGYKPYIYPTLDGTIQIEWEDDYTNYDIECSAWEKA